MRRETFETPGPLTLDIRVPIGDIDLETAEGTETTVEVSGSPELEEAARIEMRPRRDGHEVSVIIEKRSGLFRAFREDCRVPSHVAAGSGRRGLDRVGRRRCARPLRRRSDQHRVRRRRVRARRRRGSGQLRER